MFPWHSSSVRAAGACFVVLFIGALGVGCAEAKASSDVDGVTTISVVTLDDDPLLTDNHACNVERKACSDACTTCDQSCDSQCDRFLVGRAAGRARATPAYGRCLAEQSKCVAERTSCRDRASACKATCDGAWKSCRTTHKDDVALSQ